MWYTQVPDFPFGKKGVRRLLVVRAFFGFFGLWCLYCKFSLFSALSYLLQHGHLF
jgi:hypothetical protein